MIASTKTPPTTPPAIAPVLLDLEEPLLELEEEAVEVELPVEEVPVGGAVVLPEPMLEVEVGEEFVTVCVCCVSVDSGTAHRNAR